MSPTQTRWFCPLPCFEGMLKIKPALDGKSDNDNAEGEVQNQPVNTLPGAECKTFVKPLTS